VNQNPDVKWFVFKPLYSVFLAATLGILAVAGCAHTATETPAAASTPAAPVAPAVPAKNPALPGRMATAFESNGIAMSSAVVDATNSADLEFKKLMEADDLAQGEVDGWIRENIEFGKRGAGVPPVEMRQRVLKRLEPIRQAYEDFLRRHPDHAEAHVAFASFLGDLGDEEGSRDHLEKARELNPADPAIWNNLANYYGHDGPVTNAFAYYAKAIELDPKEPVYYQNFATTVYLFRHDATNFYNITEPEVFNKALDLYAQALKLDPTNFTLATDLAESYYGITPLRTNDALQSWTNAFSIARDDIERQGVHIHFARIKLNIGRFDEARAHLDAVSDPMYDELKKRLLRNLDQRIKQAGEPQTNSEPRWMGLIPAPEGATNGPPAEQQKP